MPINRGWFTKGKSGNPAGRPRNAMSRASAKRVIETVIDRALRGDTNATSILTETGIITGDKNMFFRDQGRPSRACDAEVHVVHEPEVSQQQLAEVMQRIQAIEQFLMEVAQRADEENGNGGNNVEDEDVFGHSNPKAYFGGAIGAEHRRLDREGERAQNDRAFKDRAFVDAFTDKSRQMQRNLKAINERNRAAAKGK